MSEPSAVAPPRDEEPGPAPGQDPVDDAAETGPIGMTGRSAPAEQIGKYEVVALLGRGGMGAVYKAFDPILEREVAVKVMLPQIAEDPEQKQRFEREARAIARLAHANVVTVFDLGYHTDGAPYIVMELLQGQELLQLMHREPPLPLSQKISIIVQVLNGVGQAHKFGIVHRDIKPANVSITEDGTAKLMDFGIAHLASASATAEGSIMGTAAYMSPEQARGAQVDGRSDLFSVGSLLCELVTGRRPFEAESIMATLYAIDHHEPCIELPAGAEYERLRPVIEKALTKDREERFQSSAEFAAVLTACLDDSGVISAPGLPPPAPEEADTEAPPSREPTHTVGDYSSPSPVAEPPAVAETPARPANPSKLFRILREIYVGGKSGHLHFTAGRSCRSLRLLKGQILYETSDADGEHLGDVLVRHGMLTEHDRQNAVQTVLQQRRRLGEVLVGDGLLEQGRLEEAIGLHVREILFAMLEGPEGSHSFEETAEHVPDLTSVCRLSTGEVILEATRYVQDPELVRKVLGDTDRKLALSTDPMLRAQKITLTPTDGFVMSRVDGTLSAREVLSLSPVSTEDTERSLFGLLCTGVIDYQDPAPRHRTNPPSRHGTNPPRVATDRTNPVTTGTRPVGVIPPRPGTTPLRSVAAPAAAPAATPMPTPIPTPTSTSKPVFEPTPPPPAPVPGGRVDTARVRAAERDAEELRQLILESHARLKLDHFQVLGLERSATEDDVRAAYSRFARVLHPDARRPPELADVEEKRDEVFLRVTAAYETLKDSESRKKYEIAFEPSKLKKPAAPKPSPASPEDKPSAPPPPPPPPEEPAASRFDPAATLQAAEAQFAKEDYWDVIQKVEPLIPQTEGPLRTRGVLLLARAYMKNPHWQKRAEEALLQLLQDDPGCTPAYLFLGQIYAGQGLTSRARSMYRKVVELEPEHQAALGELRKLDPLPEEEKAEGHGGRLKGWFKGR